MGIFYTLPNKQARFTIWQECLTTLWLCWRTLLIAFSFCLFQSLPLLLTGKVKQEPSVYRDGPPYQRRGSLQLWQFLVTLLDDPANGHFIAWTGRGMEFKLIEPEEVSPRLCAALLTSSVTFVIYSLYLSLVVFRWLVAGASKRTDLP